MMRFPSCPPAKPRGLCSGGRRRCERDAVLCESVAHARYVLLQKHGADLDEAGVWVGRSLENEEPRA